MDGTETGQLQTAGFIVRGLESLGSATTVSVG
jgi:hypothetical protein